MDEKNKNIKDYKETDRYDELSCEESFDSEAFEEESLNDNDQNIEPNEEESVCPCCARKTERSDAQKKKLINRLKRIEGQVRGLESMIKNDIYCNDILIQSAAVNAAMNGFNRELLECHLRHCVVDDIRNGRDEVVDELLGTLHKLMK